MGSERSVKSSIYEFFHKQEKIKMMSFFFQNQGFIDDVLGNRTFSPLLGNLGTILSF